MAAYTNSSDMTITASAACRSEITPAGLARFVLGFPRVDVAVDDRLNPIAANRTVVNATTIHPNERHVTGAR